MLPFEPSSGLLKFRDGKSLATERNAGAHTKCDGAQGDGEQREGAQAGKLNGHRPAAQNIMQRFQVASVEQTTRSGGSRHQEVRWHAVSICNLQFSFFNLQLPLSAA